MFVTDPVPAFSTSSIVDRGTGLNFSLDVRAQQLAVGLIGEFLYDKIIGNEMARRGKSSRKTSKIDDEVI